MSYPLSQIITNYLDTKHMKQADLADLLNVDERTLRRWKSEEIILRDIRELKRIAEVLGVPPETLGVAPEHIPFTPDDIDFTIDHLWKLTRNAKYYEAS